jgi:hypothetical protein
MDPEKWINEGMERLHERYYERNRVNSLSNTKGVEGGQSKRI